MTVTANSDVMPRSAATLTKWWPTMPLPTTTSRRFCLRALPLPSMSRVRASEARNARDQEGSPEVAPPRRHDASHVEPDEARDGETRTARRFDRRAERTRNEVAAERTDCSDEPNAGRRFAARCSHGCGEGLGTSTSRALFVKRAEDDRNHAVGRAVADSRHLPLVSRT